MSDFCPAQSAIKNGDKRTSVHWSGSPLCQTLARFAKDNQFGFLLDRRVDPSRSLDFAVSDTPLELLLTDLADSLGLECFFLKNTVYLGPKESCLLLHDILERHKNSIETLPARTRQAFQKKINIEIEFLENPVNALKKIARQVDLSWTNLDTLPHDLWNETQLSGLAPDEALSLLLIGFQLDYQTNERTIELVSIAQDIRPKPNTPDSKKPKPEKSRMESPKSETSVNKKPADEIPLSRRRFTLKIESQNLAAVLDALTHRMDLELDVDKSSLERKNISLEQPVSLDVKNATASQLFRSLLRPLNIEFRIQNDRLRIY